MHVYVYKNMHMCIYVYIEDVIIFLLEHLNDDIS